MCGEGCSDDETMMDIEEVRPTREAYMLYIYIIWYDEEARHNMPSQTEESISVEI
jgi:hypothetical protein